jgi:serine/threonine protein kinase
MDDNDRKVFFREVEALKRLDNPFIIKLYDSFKENDHFFIATEYGDGGSLDQFLKR